MAEGEAFSFLGKLAEHMVDPIVRQFSYIFSYNSNIENLEQELKRLQAARDGMKLQVLGAEYNLETVDPTMQLWLKGADEMEGKTFVVIERKSKVEKTCLNLGCLNVKQRYLLSRKATKLIDSIGKHKGDGVKYAKSTHSAFPPGIVTDDALTPKLPTRIAFPPSEEFESRKSIVEQVMEALNDDGVSMIGICGIGGVGKTTMANEVCRRAKEQGLFEHFAMTCVSQTQDLLKIQKELAGMLGLHFADGDTILLRAQRLRERLSKGRKILVVLDDVWKELPLQEVGIPTGCIGCKVICTSRCKDVLTDMGSIHSFDVEVLTDGESWDLFEENVGVSHDTSDQYATAKKIVRKCGGLPIAIVTLAKALKHKEKHVWDNALRHLEESTGEKIRGMAENVYKCIELSYEFLKDNGARTLLLLCCLFQEDSSIGIKTLVRFKDLAALEETKDGVHTLVGNLISSNLLVGGKHKSWVKVHDVVRDVCLSIEGLNKLWKNCETSSGMVTRSFISRKVAFYEEAGSQAFKQVMDALADDQICTIGICVLGVGDFGAGTLVKEVIRKVNEVDLFDDVAMIETQDLCEMQGDLARTLGLTFVREVTSITERAKHLRARLTDGRKTLIIISVGYWIWNREIDLEKVGIPVGDEHYKRCKVVIVSPYEDVCLNMGSEKIVKVDPLSKEEALVLLREHARFDEDLDPIAQQIVEKCQGQPWAIVRLGEALKNQNKNVWLDALRQLFEGSFPNCTVRFNYNCLCSRQVQMLLLLIGIMGRKVDTRIEKLVVMYVKLFKGVEEDLEAARENVYDLLQELHDRFLLQIDVDENKVSVYPLVSYVCLEDIENIY